MPKCWASAAPSKGCEIRQRVGYVPERPTLYEWMTVEEIGWFTAGFYGPGFLPEYARLIAQFGLPPRKKLKALSKGTHAKVVLSLALAHQPELLILDEPTSGLDALVRREFLESMVDRAAQGQTVFLSSHQIAEVERVADIVAILRKGKLLLVEPLDQLKAQVRRLTVTLKDGVTTLPELGGQILSQRWKPRQWQALVRGVTDEQLAALRGHEAVDDVEVHSTSLEDIFVAYMQGDNGADSQIARPDRLAGGSTIMNRSIFWRLVWKEYRLQRALWIAMAVLTGLLLLVDLRVAFPRGTDRCCCSALPSGCPPSTPWVAGPRCLPANRRPKPTNSSGRCRSAQGGCLRPRWSLRS